MKEKVKKTIITLCLTGSLVIASASTVLAVSVGGGIWDYGTKVSGLNQKTVWSNYYHPTRMHKSSVTIGTTAASSGWVDKGSTSYASAVGSWSDQTHAYYDYL